VTVDALLKQRYPAELVDELLRAYKEIEENYSLSKWKASELDAGHFVEAARRIIEWELRKGQYTPIGQQLPNFNDVVLKQYENLPGDESFRILIPRILYGVYGIRNKRGVGHVGKVSPNKMDSTLILGNAKWVLAELVRLVSGLKPEETQALVDAIVERKLDMLWKHGDITRVLNTNLKTHEEVLILLLDRSPQTVAELQKATEYARADRFRKILQELHKTRFIEVTADGRCIITDKGTLEAEKILKKHSGLVS